jgi:hypothetical protein
MLPFKVLEPNDTPNMVLVLVLILDELAQAETRSILADS